jgi:galactose mutarotase-like enzyme
MTVYEISNNNISVKINSLGAEVCSVYSKQNNIEYCWQASKDIWPRYAPVLFPIVGKLKENLFKYKNQEYSLPQHGFARDCEFNCIEKTDTSICFELSANENTLKNFPFHFNLQIQYELFENTLSTTYIVFNPDNDNLLFSIGAHPGFNCPLLEDENFNDYFLQFNDVNKLVGHKLNNGLIDKETYVVELRDGCLEIDKSLFNNDALVFKNNQVNQVKLVSKVSGHGIEMHCQNWPYFGIWTKKDTEKFICLEPWYGIADNDDANQNLLDKDGLITLIAHEKFNSNFQVSFF